MRRIVLVVMAALLSVYAAPGLSGTALAAREVPVYGLPQSPEPLSHPVVESAADGTPYIVDGRTAIRIDLASTRPAETCLGPNQTIAGTPLYGVERVSGGYLLSAAHYRCSTTFYLLHRSGVVDKQLTTTPDGDEWPVVSRSGEVIAWATTNDPTGTPARSTIRVYDVDGDRVVRRLHVAGRNRVEAVTARRVAVTRMWPGGGDGVVTRSRLSILDLRTERMTSRSARVVEHVSDNLARALISAPRCSAVLDLRTGARLARTCGDTALIGLSPDGSVVATQSPEGYGGEVVPFPAQRSLTLRRVGGGLVARYDAGPEGGLELVRFEDDRTVILRVGPSSARSDYVRCTPTACARVVSPRSYLP